MDQSPKKAAVRKSDETDVVVYSSVWICHLIAGALFFTVDCDQAETFEFNPV